MQLKPPRLACFGYSRPCWSLILSVNLTSCLQALRDLESKYLFFPVNVRCTKKATTIGFPSKHACRAGRCSGLCQDSSPKPHEPQPHRPELHIRNLKHNSFQPVPAAPKAPRPLLVAGASVRGCLAAPLWLAGFWFTVQGLRGCNLFFPNNLPQIKTFPVEFLPQLAAEKHRATVFQNIREPALLKGNLPPNVWFRLEGWVGLTL